MRPGHGAVAAFDVDAGPLNDGLQPGAEAAADAEGWTLDGAIRRIRGLRRQIFIVAAILAAILVCVGAWRLYSWQADEPDGDALWHEAENPFKIQRNSESKMGFMMAIEEKQTTDGKKAVVTEISEGAYVDVYGVVVGDWVLSIGDQDCAKGTRQSLQQAVGVRPLTMVIGRPVKYRLITNSQTPEALYQPGGIPIGYSVTLPPPEWDSIRSPADGRRTGQVTAPMGTRQFYQALQSAKAVEAQITPVPMLSDLAPEGFIVAFDDARQAALIESLGGAKEGRAQDIYYRTGGGIQPVNWCEGSGHRLLVKMDRRMIDLADTLVNEAFSADGWKSLKWSPGECKGGRDLTL